MPPQGNGSLYPRQFVQLSTCIRHVGKKASQGMLWDRSSLASTMSTPETDRISLDSEVQSLHHGYSPFLLSSFNDDLRLETSVLFVCLFSVTVVKYLKLDKKC